MIKHSLISKLYSYNIHIGHLDCYNSQLNFYIIGRRFSFYIININKTFLLLKKVIYLLNTLALNNGSLLFHYSRYTYVDIIYRCVLLSISKKSNQQIITFNWRYGSMGNFFFSFYVLIKEITKSWIKQHTSLFSFEKNLNIYYNFNSEYSSLDSFEYLFLNEPGTEVSPEYTKSYIDYSTWYVDWIKTQDSYSFWKSNKHSLKYNNFLKKLCLNDINNVLRKKNILNFKYLFLKFFYYMSFKKKEDPFLFKYTDDILSTSFIKDKFLSYWRFFLYFKYFNNYYQVPDALFSVFPDNNDLPVKEYSNSNLISIGLVDTITNINNVQYPIISNDDSFMIVLFYFTLFSNLFLENKLNIYNFLKKSK